MADKYFCEVCKSTVDITNGYVAPHNWGHGPCITGGIVVASIQEKPKDLVNHPPHYTFAPGYEVIDVIEAWGLDFRLANAVKYIARQGKKGSGREDLDKAIWYITRFRDKEYPVNV